jgi:glycosyltransferase involved in cell wall biosynthesis
MKLSIIMMAYNQGRFIDEAIASVIAQHLPFQWELLISDDMSQDSTEEIVSHWVRKYPGNIIYLSNTVNLGLHRNYERLVRQSKGEYVALLEADDYWLDSMKSFRQVTFLDNNPDVAWCTTNGIVVNDRKEVVKKVVRALPEKFNFEYYLDHYFNPLNNATVFRRATEPSHYPEFFFQVKQWDTVLNYLRSLHGNIGYLQIDGVAWRRHEGATSFSQEFTGAKRYQNWIVLNKEIGRLVPKKMARTYFNSRWAYEKLAIFHWRQRQFVPFLRFTMLLVLNTHNRFLKSARDFLWSLRNS